MFAPHCATVTIHEPSAAPESRNSATGSPTPESSTAARALAAAGDAESARDVSALDAAARAAAERLGRKKRGLVERLIYGPRPDTAELQSGAIAMRDAGDRGRPIVDAALRCLARGEAFTADGKLSAA